MKVALALGTFDGLHPGHRAVLRETAGFFSVAVSFAIPPKAVLGGNCELLMLPQDKCRALKHFGIDRVDFLDFETVRDLSPDEFLTYLTDTYNPSKICCGYDYRFGKNGAGDPKQLEEYCRENGIAFYCANPVTENGSPVSSTDLRNLLRTGNVEEANRFIYGGFGYTATVIHGDQRGRLLGFPTVNQQYPAGLTVLKPGVYAAKIFVDGKCYDGISNIGIRPTFETADIRSETYVKDFSADIYGKEATLKPIRFLRPEQKFSSVEALTEAIRRDVAALNDSFAENCGTQPFLY